MSNLDSDNARKFSNRNFRSNKAVGKYGPFLIVALAVVLVANLAPTRYVQPAITKLSFKTNSSAQNLCATDLTISTLKGCKIKWSGSNNGGATWNGVTGNSINIVAYGSPDNALIADLLGGEGPGKLIGTPQEEAHTMQVYETWFNRNFQTYGRHVNLISYTSAGSLTNASAISQSDAVAIDKKDHAFLVVGGELDDGFFTQLTKEHIISIAGAQLPESFYQQNAPYVFGMLATTNTQNAFISSFVCNQLGPNSVASFGGNNSNPPVNGQPRKYGIIFPTTNADGTPSIYSSVGQDMSNQLKSRCGIKVAPQDIEGYSLNPASAISQVQASGSRLEQDHVTTIICLCDPISPTFSAKSMEQQGYFPEIVETGYLLQDYYQLDQLYDQKVWKHTFGISSLPVSSSPKNSLYYQAYESIDPKSTPTPDAQIIFYELLLAFAGIQGAGPHLTAQTFAQAMFDKVKIISNSPSTPTFEYSPNDYGGIRDAQIVWWDPTMMSPDGKPGDFASVDGGYRFTPKDWPKIPATTLFDNQDCLSLGSCGLPSYPATSSPGPGP